MIYVFEEYAFDTRLFELRYAGESRKLEPKVFDLLAYLVLHRDRVVSKDELLEHVWPNQFISDTTFDHCVMTARKAIGDSGKTQRFIKTMPKRGYRFIAPLEVQSDDVTAPELPGTLQARQVPDTAHDVEGLQAPEGAADRDCCQRCDQYHAAGANFCGACGLQLSRRCPQCRHANSPGNNFCNLCGHALSPHPPSAPATGTTEPAAYTPRHLAEEILTTRSALEGERKQVTVLFCDLVNSMELVDRLGPDRMHTLLNRFFEFSLSAVHRYGGTINQFLGDGFMALFGAPLAYEDHARRAVFSALELRHNLQERRIDFADVSLQLQVRMGLHTGVVVVGSIGDNLRMDYTAIGETTHLASRVEQSAAPWTICVSETTATLVQDDVRLEVLGPMYVKGRSESITVSNVVERRPLRSPLEWRGQRMLRRFVGRERELHILHELVQQAERGRGQVIGIIGEPGMGKSRLLYEFCHSVDATRLTFLEGRCLPFGQAMPYLPVLDMLRQHLGITAHDPPEKSAEKVQLGLQALKMDPLASQAYLRQFLGMKIDTQELAMQRSESIKSRTCETLCQMWLKLSHQQPLVIIVEDLHWVDTSSEEFFTSLIDALAGAPVFFLATYRPGYRPPWVDKSYMTQLALQPLTHPESLMVVHAVLQQDMLSHSLAQMILEKTDGNPLFLEELTLAVAKDGDMYAHAGLPDTIQGVLMARIDHLSDAAKRVLQTASVLGRTFSLRLLRRVWDGPAMLDACIQELARHEFVYSESEGEEPMYSFKHALTQEVAYDSLLIGRRQRLHAAVGHALETLYADRLEDIYDRLAHHYSKAQHADKAVTYLTHLADKMAREHAHVEAVLALQDAIGHGMTLAATPVQDTLLVELHLRLASSLYALGRYQEALDGLQSQEALFKTVDDPRLNGRLALVCSQTYTMLEDWETATAYAHQAVEAAKQCQDEATMGQAYHVLAMERYWMGYPQEGMDYSRHALTCLAHTTERSRLGMAYFVLGLNALLLGDFPTAQEAADSVGAMGASIADAHLQTFAAWLGGWLASTQGEFDAGITLCKRALAVSPDPLNTALALGWLGYTYVEKGEPNEAIPHLEQAIERLRQSGYRRLEAAYTTFLGEAFLLRGALDRARDLARQGHDLARAERYRLGVAWAQRALGRIAQAEGNVDEAERYFLEAQSLFAALQAKFEIGRTHLALSTLSRGMANREAITMHVTEAHQVFMQLGVPMYVERAEQRARELGLILSVSPEADTSSPPD